MKLQKCPLCDNIRPLPFHVTELEDGKVKETYSLCHDCAVQYLDDGQKAYSENGSLQPETPPEEEMEDFYVDLAHIQTPEQLLDFIASHEKVSQIKPCPDCELTWSDFDKHGRFGCPTCYDHFHEIIDPILDRYHGDSFHYGKRPKRELENDPEEKRKFLKLQMAYAVEHENYEEASKIKKQIEAIDSCSCETDQPQCGEGQH